MNVLFAMLAALLVGSYAASPSAAAPLGSAAGVPRSNFAWAPGVQDVNHHWNHHCTWRHSYRRNVRVCWWSSRRHYGPSIYFRFGPDRRYYDRRYNRWR